jgi:rhamnulose-1-phosphate aldolase
MQNMLEAPFVKEMARICSTMYRLGWDERNGGNISYIIDDEAAAPYLDTKARGTPLAGALEAKSLAGKLVLVTATGNYFRNVEYDPERNLGILRINLEGAGAEIVWGFAGGGRPTSELASHLWSHEARLKKDPAHRVVLHCHAPNILAMSFIHPLNERDFSRSLWRMITECIIVFPEGVGVLPWMVCGNDEIGRATAEKMAEYRSCVWAQHGIFGSGQNLDEAFGLVETIEKAALIYLKIGDHKVLNTITDSGLKILAETFKVPYRKEFLDV